MEEKPEPGSLVKLLAVSSERRRSYIIRLREKGVYSTIAGPVKAEDIVEAGYGGSITSYRGIVYVLSPTWLEILESRGARRTQVIYPKDSGYMVLRAGLRVGSRVFEAGLGSGFLSSVILNVICPRGVLVGAEAREEFYEAVLSNVRMLGFEECLDARLGDALEVLNAFNKDFFDAVFLDMPEPERVLSEVARVARPGAVVAVFLPTTSQVDRVLKGLPEGLVVESVEEVLLRRWEPNPGALRPSPRMIGHTGFLVFLRALAFRV